MIEPAPRHWVPRPRQKNSVGCVAGVLAHADHQLPSLSLLRETWETTITATTTMRPETRKKQGSQDDNTQNDQNCANGTRTSANKTQPNFERTRPIRPTPLEWKNRMPYRHMSFTDWMPYRYLSISGENLGCHIGLCPSLTRCHIGVYPVAPVRWHVSSSQLKKTSPRAVYSWWPFTFTF